MVILEGYSVAGVHIVVLGLSIGCQVVWVTSRLYSHLDGGGPGDSTWESVSFVSGAHSKQVLRIYVSLLSDYVNCRNYEYYTVCDISM